MKKGQPFVWVYRFMLGKLTSSYKETRILTLSGAGMEVVFLQSGAFLWGRFPCHFHLNHGEN